MAIAATKFRLGAIILTGIVAGVIFAAFEMLAAAVLMGANAAVMPLRMIGAIVLGAAALEPGYPLVTAAMTGVIVHVVLSVIFAGVFAVVAPPITDALAGGFSSTPAGLALAGMVFGIVLWIVNFYGVAPFAGWSWFPERTDPLVQFLAHAFFFGAPIGWMLARSRAVLGPTL